MQLLTLSTLTDDEKDLMRAAAGALVARRPLDARHNAYFNGKQRLDQIGLAVPPELRRFETVVNWPRVVVEEITNRADVRGFALPGKDGADEKMREQWDANNLDASSPQVHTETAIHGRGFVSVGTNDEDPEHPIIAAEPSAEMGALVDARRKQMDACVRSYRDPQNRALRTLYLPNSTIWLANTRRGWVVEDRDDHDLGRVPIVMFLNRQRPGEWWGTSEMADVIPLTDAAARSLTNLQVAQESHVVPARYAFGVDPDKMVDAKTGERLTVWEAYFTALMVTKDKDVNAGQFAAADLANFTNTIDHYGQLAASVSGLPIRYFVVSQVNPAAEGAIRADESRMIRNVERKQASWGSSWGWVMGLSERLRTGEWPEANRIKTLWFDAGTPTFAQRADAISKMAGGVPILSREGAWDELGWSEARKSRERDYFGTQDADPTLERVARALGGTQA